MSYSKLKKSGISHVCLRVYDPVKSGKFFHDVFGAKYVCEWGKDENEDHAVFVDLGEGDYLEIFNELPPEGYDPNKAPEKPSGLRMPVGTWQHLAVWVDDIDATYQKALDHGAVSVSTPKRSNIPTRTEEIVRMRYGFILGPCGEFIEMIQDIVE